MILIKGKPIAKKRPRFVVKNGRLWAYNSQETEESLWIYQAQEQIDFKYNEPIGIEVTFYLPRPKNHYGTGKNAGKLKKNAPHYHTKKPDLDNLEKFCFDCLNNLAWIDDAQIISVVSSKKYDDLPRTEIEIMRMENDIK